jgi:hypothetical protein
MMLLIPIAALLAALLLTLAVRQPVNMWASAGGNRRNASLPRSLSVPPTIVQWLLSWILPQEKRAATEWRLEGIGLEASVDERTEATIVKVFGQEPHQMNEVTNNDWTSDFRDATSIMPKSRDSASTEHRKNEEFPCSANIERRCGAGRSTGDDSQPQKSIYMTLLPKTFAQQFFHGTRADLKTGDHIALGFDSNFRSGSPLSWVYFTATLDAAIWGAELARGNARERIYVVEPLGEKEDDPNVTDKRFPGNPTLSYRSREPLRVIGEVVGWHGHSPEQLRQRRESLERLMAEGKAVIID